MRTAILHRSMSALAAILIGTLLADNASAQAPKETPKNAAEIRKALDQKVTLDFTTQSFFEAVDHLKEKTKVNIVVDMYAMQIMGTMGFVGGLGAGGGVGAFGGGGGGIPGMPGAPAHPINLKIDNGKVGVALQNLLKPLQLTYVILADSVLVTSEELGHQRQLRQRVSIDAKDLPLADALQKLSDETGINLLFDPREATKAKSKITAQLDNVSVETAVRLLTSLADLSSVSVGNIVFVTGDARAEKLRKENASSSNAPFVIEPSGVSQIGPAGMAMPGLPGFPPPPVPDPPPGLKKGGVIRE